MLLPTDMFLQKTHGKARSQSNNLLQVRKGRPREEGDLLKAMRDSGQGKINSRFYELSAWQSHDLRRPFQSRVPGWEHDYGVFLFLFSVLFFHCHLFHTPQHTDTQHTIFHFKNDSHLYYFLVRASHGGRSQRSGRTLLPRGL